MPGPATPAGLDAFRGRWERERAASVQPLSSPWEDSHGRSGRLRREPAQHLDRDDARQRRHLRKAAGLARNPRFQSLFKDRAQARRTLADALKAEVRGLGAEPWDKGSFRARTQRVFLELRDRIGGHSDKPLIEAVEHEEDFIRDQFAETAGDSQLPARARQLLEQALGALQAEHDEIATIRREFD
jgi:uncharacterized protein (TIGR02284 family)